MGGATMWRTGIALGLAALALALAACEEKSTPACRAGATATATCMEACAKLDALDCRVAPTVAECVSVCEAADAPLDPSTRGRVNACYAMANSCADVDDCSLACGPGGGPVPFEGSDAGASGDEDAGM